MGNSVAYLESRYMQLHRSLNSYGKIGLAVGTATAAVNVGAGAGVTVMFLGYESKTEGEMDLTQQIGAIPVVFGGLAVCSVLKGAAFGAAWPVTLFSMWPRFELARRYGLRWMAPPFVPWSSYIMSDCCLLTRNSRLPAIIREHRASKI